MSKARPNAYMYEKWLQGIAKAVPDPAERCSLLEYICKYQFAQIYSSCEMPDADELPQAAKVALCLLEGDLQEVCEVREENNQTRAANGRPKQTQADPSRGGQTQNNTIQNNTIQNNIQSPKPPEGARERNYLFECGISLLRSGYINPRQELNQFAQYVENPANRVKDPNALAKRWQPNTSKTPQHEKGNMVADFLEGIGCNDASLLCEILEAKQVGNVYVISAGTPQAFAQIEQIASQPSAQRWLNGRILKSDR